MSRVPRPGGEFMATIALVCALVLLAVGFAAPWAEGPAIESTPLARYLPYPHGQSWLEHYPGAGWVSVNVRRIPVRETAHEWSPGAARGLATVLRDGGRAGDELREAGGDVAVLEIHSKIQAEGAPFPLASEQRVVRDSRGDWLISRQDGGTAEMLYIPPLLIRPSRFGVTDQRWTDTTRIGTADTPPTDRGTVSWTGQVTARRRLDSALGRFGDCVRVRYERTETQPGTAGETGFLTEWDCAGVGPVGNVVSSSAAPPRPLQRSQLPPPNMPPTSRHAALPAGSNGWVSAVWGSAGPTSFTSEATFAPVYVDGHTPLVLAASQALDVRALDATQSVAVPVWQFSAAGPVYARPVVDYRHDRIYLGSVDKRLYALNTNGMYLWSVPTSDNVGAAALVVDDTVVVTGEDGTVRGFDAVSGTPAWATQHVTGAVVSDPAAIGSTVAVATESGAVYGLNTVDGTLTPWADAGGPVTAAVTADGRAFYVLTTTGVATSFTVKGVPRILTDSLAGQSSDPVLNGGVLFMVDVADQLVAVDTGTGEVLDVAWDVDRPLTGPPVAAHDAVFALDIRGAVHRLDRNTGAATKTWPAPRIPQDATVLEVARLGLSAGNGLWWADAVGAVRHVGPVPAVGADDVR